METHELLAACSERLTQTWQRITEFADQPLPPLLPLIDQPDLIPLITQTLQSRTKTYHYVLITQLLAKTVDPSLNAQSLQAAHDAEGAFDARTVAHKVVVPFDQANYRVLGGSPEPYVNNPVRVPAISEAYRSQQKSQADWDALVTVLTQVQNRNDPIFTHSVFEQVLFEIYGLLDGVHVVYPTPNRVSLDGIQRVISGYLETQSGGERLEAVCTALFQTIGDRFGIFDEVRRTKVNAADASSGMLADIECRLNEQVIFLVEVKDRALTLTQLDAKLDAVRSERIAELLFLAKSGDEIAGSDATQIRTRVQSEFASGHNVYISNFGDFALGILMLLGEPGRNQFLRNVGAELDRVNAAIAHRRAWSQILRSV